MMKPASVLQALMMAASLSLGAMACDDDDLEDKIEEKADEIEDKVD